MIFRYLPSRTRAFLVIFCFLNVLFIACGQDPSFVNIGRDKQDVAPIVSRGDSVRSSDSSASDDENVDDFGDGEGGVLGDVVGDGPSSSDENTSPDSTDQTTASTNSSSDVPSSPDDHTIPDISTDDLAKVKKCLTKWGRTPFPKEITSVKKLVAVSIGGIGVPINDTQATSEPQLTIIYAGVNVGGATTYNLLNPNGYYCMLVNVNVSTDLTVNLNCNARLADTVVDVEVLSRMSDNTAAIGVNVNSSVLINTTRPQGQSCIR